MKKLFVILVLLATVTGCASNKAMNRLENRVTQNEQRVQVAENIARQTGIVAVQNSNRLDEIYKPGCGKTDDTGYLVEAVDHITRLSGETKNLNERVTSLEERRVSGKSSALDSRFEKLLQATTENRDLIDHGKEVQAFPVYFRTGSWAIKENLCWLLEEGVDLENATIVGYADTTGDKEKNRELSMKRAEAVKAALEELGVESSRIKIRAFGETERYGFGGSDKNRRAVVYAQKNPTQ